MPRRWTLTGNSYRQTVVEGPELLPWETIEVEEVVKVTANTVGPSNKARTSQAAAFANAPRSGTQRWKVLKIVTSYGEMGITREKIAELTGLPDSSVRPRVWELVKGGWIKERTDQYGITRAGEGAALLIATEKIANRIL